VSRLWIVARRLASGCVALAVVVGVLVACADGVVPSVQSVSIEGPEARLLMEGETLQLQVAVDAVGGAPVTVNWTSSDEAVAVVSSSGLIVALCAGGPVTITATSVFDASAQDAVTVEVTPLPLVSGATGGTYLDLTNARAGRPDATGPGTRAVGFDLGWSESWRGPAGPTYVDAADNWDAVWLFAKFRVGDGAWRHARLAATGHGIPVGAVLDVTTDGTGAFVYRAAPGYGRFDVEGLSLVWDYAADGVAYDDPLEFRLFGIEMVFVPQGGFALGSGGSGTGEFRAGGTPNVPFVVSSQSSISLGNSAGQLTWSQSTWTGEPMGSTNASFPTGFAAFYVMKHEVTQGQYVAFLNTLVQAQADVRKHTGSTYRYTITGSSVGSYAASLPYVGMNHVSWADGAAFVDWAALRPLTELEFEKAARGTATAVPNEYAWGSTSITQAMGLANAATMAETPTPANANANFYEWETGIPVDGPVRVGAFAMPGDSRRDAGAGYYGALELSGNLWESAVTLGNAEGRAFAGTHGDGVLDAGGNANVPSWPGSSAVGTGARGGSFGVPFVNLPVSDRTLSTEGIASRSVSRGWRGARTAP